MRFPQLFASLFLASAVATTVSFARQTLPLDSGWSFHLGDAAGAQAPAFDASTWPRVDVPHDWSVAQAIDPKAPSAGGGGFYPMGIGWYRKMFDAPAAWQGERISVEFDGVYRAAQVWINGQSLGTHPYGYTPFRYDLTPYLKFGGANVLAVRVDNSAQPNSRWYSGSGIYRHVRLVVTSPIHVQADSVFVQTAALSNSSATLKVALGVRNGGKAPGEVPIDVAILNAAGAVVAHAQAAKSLAAETDAGAEFTLQVAHPSAWSPESPSVYSARIRLRGASGVFDEVTVPFGIRTLRVSGAAGLELNGKSIKLVGGNMHADNGPLGAAAFDRAEERRVEIMKAAGFNAIRTSHNPPSPAFLAACDRLGVLVVDEAFDGWEKGKNPFDYHVDFKTWWRRDIDAMVRRDRNHPSVVFWSIGNEMPERMSANGLRIARELTGRIRELDPTRPITAAVNGPGKNGDWSKADPLFATLDVAGYNYELGRHVKDHARVPGRVIMATESYQSETYANWATTQETPYVIGDFVWSGMDYLGEAGIGRVFLPGEPIVKHWQGNMYPWHGAACGDIDITGFRKPISHYRQIVWDRGERLYASVLTPAPAIAPGGDTTRTGWGVSPWAMPPALPSWTWPGEEGKVLSVEVDARYDAVRLYLNGRLVGEKPTTRAEEFKAVFPVTYAPGKLRVVGVQGGREEESFVLETAGPAQRVRLTPDRSTIHADGQDLSFVTVEIVDAAGRLVPTADPSVHFDLRGPGAIAAIGNADLTSMETYVTNPHRVFQGRALLVIRASEKSGAIALSATSPGLAETSVAIHAK